MPDYTHNHKERDGEFYEITPEESQDRYQQSKKSLGDKISRWQDVTVNLVDRSCGQMCDIYVTHVPTMALVRCFIAAELALSVDQPRSRDTIDFAMESYACGIKAKLEQTIADVQSSRQSRDPFSTWVDYSLDPKESSPTEV